MTNGRQDDPASPVPPGAGRQVPRVSPPGAVRALQATVATSGLQVLIVVLTLARSKTIAVLLEPQGVGIVGAVDQLVQFVVQLSALSLPIAPMKFVSRNLTKGHDAVNQIYQALFKALLLSSCLGTGLSMALLLPGEGAGLGRALSA